MNGKDKSLTDDCPKRKVQNAVRFKDLLLASRVYLGKVLVINHVFPNSNLMSVSWEIEFPHLCSPLVEHFLGSQVYAVSQQCTASTPHGAQGMESTEKHLVRK